MTLLRSDASVMDPGMLAALVGVPSSRLETLVGGPIAGVRPLSSFRPVDSPRQSFRIDRRDGETRKLRRVESAADRVRIVTMNGASDPCDFAPILASEGCLLVEAWIAGTPLGCGGHPRDTLATAGALLGRIHERWPVSRSEDTAAIVTAIDADLAQLRSAGALGPEDCDAAMAAVRRHDPGTTAMGVIHRDFCGENIVRRAEGSLCVVDNEDVSIGALDGDLVRALQRWGLDAAGRAAFLDGYARVRSPRTARRDVVFWSMWSWSLSAGVRLGAGDRATAVRRAGSIRRLARMTRDEASPAAMAAACHV